MAANTVTSWECLMRLAEEVGSVRSGFITAVNSTVVTVPGISKDLDPGANFLYGLAAIEGKGIRRITGHFKDTDEITSAVFSAAAAAGDLITVAWWDPREQDAARKAINQAIFASYPFWYREVVLDLTHTSNSIGATVSLDELDAAQSIYDLPSDCVKLSRVGVQWDSTLEPEWFPPLRLWEQVGQEGAMQVHFLDGMCFHMEYSSMTLCLHYEAREPMFTAWAGTETTQLPLDYIGGMAGQVYSRRMVNENNLLTAQALASEAGAALGRLGYVKKPLKRGPKTNF